MTDVVSLMEVRAKAKRLALNVEYVGPIPETIQSDPAQADSHQHHRQRHKVHRRGRYPADHPIRPGL